MKYFCAKFFINPQTRLQPLWHNCQYVQYKVQKSEREKKRTSEKGAENCDKSKCVLWWKLTTRPAVIGDSRSLGTLRADGAPLAGETPSAWTHTTRRHLQRTPLPLLTFTCSVWRSQLILINSSWTHRVHVIIRNVVQMCGYDVMESRLKNSLYIFPNQEYSTWVGCRLKYTTSQRNEFLSKKESKNENTQKPTGNIVRSVIFEFWPKSVSGGGLMGYSVRLVWVVCAWCRSLERFRFLKFRWIEWVNVDEYSD